MAKSNDGKRTPTRKIDRRTMLASAPLLVGGLTALAHATPAPQGGINRQFVAEREWARTLARHVSNQLQEAAQQLPELCITSDQLEQLRRAFENTLITNMGCAVGENNPGE